MTDTDDLNKRGAARLAQLVREIKFVSKQALAELLSIDQRTISYWYQRGLSLTNARRVARCLGISADFFWDDDDLFQSYGIAHYLTQANRADCHEDRLIFDGRATFMLAQFLETNEALLDDVRNVRIETFEGAVFDAPGTAISAQVSGYRRSVVLDGTIKFGGINAVLEDYRVKTLELVGVSEMELMLPGGRFPLIGDLALAAHGPNGPDFLRSAKMHVEAIHLCARMANEQTFQIFKDILRQIKADPECCAFAFDAIKRYEAHFLHHRKDALWAQKFLRKYIKANIKRPDAEHAVSYAIEALPFCSFMDRDSRRETSLFLNEIHRRSKAFKKATDMMDIAATAAADFLPFVRQPKNFGLCGI